jgi:glycosyltransferase involved in cell wall biosynthesis
VRNGAGFIAEAIESVLAQDGVDLTVRVRDNLSSDDSVAIAERYANADPRVEVAVNEHRRGLLRAVRRRRRHAPGESRGEA